MPSRELEPGEIVLVKNGQWETKAIMPAPRVQVCSFYWVYTGFPNGVFENLANSLVRKRLGAALASRIPAKEDRAKYLGVEGLEYNTIDDLAQAIGRPRESICVDCSMD